MSYFFCASHTSIYNLLHRGIWHDMPLNSTLSPIDSSSITLLKEDGTEMNATDIKVDKYVRLTLDPLPYIAEWQGNTASIFLVEVDPSIASRVDVLKIKRIHDGRIELLKNIMIDLSLIKRVHVTSKTIEKKLRALLSSERKPIVTTPSLFPPPDSSIDESFHIPKSLTKPPSPLPPAKNLITIHKGDLLLSPMQTHVNTVNCIGVMGKGIALAFKKRYPEMFQDYTTRCKQNKVQLGVPYLYPLLSGRNILNFPTKNHWRENSKLEKIEEGLKYLVSHAAAWKIQSIALPPLGCGNGNLPWDTVLPLMQRYLCQLNIPVEIYAPHEAGSFRPEPPAKRPKHTLP